MKHSYWVFFLYVTLNACQSPVEQKITIEDIQDSSQRAANEFEEENISFFDTEQQLISPDKFNRLLAEGLYLSSEVVQPDGSQEIHLISIAKHEQLLEDQTVPNFQLTDLNGKEYSLASLKGKITVLSFWFTASMLCTKEIDKNNSLAKELKDNKNIVWLAPALDQTANLSRFLKNKNWTYRFAANQEQLATQLGVLTYPTHLIINQEGKIIKAIVRNSNSLEYIKSTLKSIS